MSTTIIEAVESRYRPTPDRSANLLALPNGSLLHTEIVRSETGMAGTVLGWGDLVTHEELEQRIADSFPGRSVIDDPGFTHFFIKPEGQTIAQAIEDEHAAVTHGVKQALDVLKWKPEQVDGVFLGSGTPTVPNYARHVAELAGLTNVTLFKNVYAACNSGAEALVQAMQLQGKRVLVVGVEGMTRLGSFDPQEVDPVSRAVFSNGIAVWAGIPGESMSLVPDTVYKFNKPDREGHLSAYMTYAMPEGSFILDMDEVYAVRLPTPPDQFKIKMNPKRTTIMFLRAFRDHFPTFWQPYQSKYGIGRIGFGAAHKASIRVWEGTIGWLAEQGLTVPFYDAVFDGNSSASNTLKAFVRLMPFMEQGKHYPIVSYGAGISGTMAVIQAGR